MSARDVIAANLPGRDGTNIDSATWAATILSALTASGYRLIGPGELDRQTIERCAVFLERFDPGDDNCRSVPAALDAAAAALRSLQGDEDA